LTPNSEVQLSLFNTSNPKHQALMGAIDKMNRSYGDNKIKFANQSLGKQFQMKQDKISKRYTTRINEVVEVKI
jgi:DNA polymerase V